MPPVLACARLSRAFGALRAVDEVDLQVVAGARHALIGPNGAGKSTLFKLVTGVMRADAGTVALAGRDVTGLSEVRRCRLGMSQTLQHASLFPSMTAAETVVLAVQRHGAGPGPAGRISPLPRRQPAVHARAEEILVEVGLAGRGGVVVPSLSHGERKQLEVAVALACRPTLLLLDEPAAGVSPGESRRLVELLAGLPAEITVLFVEHDLDLVFELADTVTVLHLGRVLLSGTPAEIRASDRVREAYLGSGRRDELFTARVDGRAGADPARRDGGAGGTAGGGAVGGGAAGGSDVP
jgi:branched-chain amino acid transport system ATP-binding protein